MVVSGQGTSGIILQPKEGDVSCLSKMGVSSFDNGTGGEPITRILPTALRRYRRSLRVVDHSKVLHCSWRYVALENCLS